MVILSDLHARFRAAIGAAFGEEHAGTDPLLRRSAHADYQANVALGLAAALKRPPRAIAEAIVEKLDLSGVCEAPAISGPGYINLRLDAAYLARAVARVGGDPRCGVEPAAAPETIVVDYSSPNVAKEMHVGHLRGAILGDALVRVLEELGHRVIRQNHLGDWGTPFGMLLEELIDAGTAALAVGDWNAFYKAARAKFESDPAFAERARSRVVLLQGGDAETLALWQQLIAESLKYLSAVYGKLGVKLVDSDVAGESLYNPWLAEVVTELQAKGLIQESDGALCVFPAGFKGKTGDPLPLIVRKQDGGYGYGTTDLAAIRYRTQTLGGTRILYVVGAPQQLHLEMVFATARTAGWLAPPRRAEHVAFGAVLGADKKMFKTRAGDTVTLLSLLDEACTRAEAIVTLKNPELAAETRAELARKVGIAAVKYADLSTDRIKDYVFDWDRMLSFEGNTAPYLQYAHARIRSIFRRPELAASLPVSCASIVIGQPAERALALDLMEFAPTVSLVADTLQPHKLCTYLFALATSFTAFYEQCPILRAESPEQQRSRLALADATASVLARGLELLGIEAPDRM